MTIEEKIQVQFNIAERRKSAKRRYTGAVKEAQKERARERYRQRKEENKRKMLTG